MLERHGRRTRLFPSADRVVGRGTAVSAEIVPAVPEHVEHVSSRKRAGSSREGEPLLVRQHQATVRSSAPWKTSPRVLSGGRRPPANRRPG